MSLDLEDTTGAIIEAAIEVHRELGPGFLESVYESALVVESELRRVPFVRQYAVPVVPRYVEVGLHRLDLFVANQVVVELKSVREIAPEHFAVVRPYLRAVGHFHGLLLNFAKPTQEIKRVLARQPPR